MEILAPARSSVAVPEITVAFVDPPRLPIPEPASTLTQSQALSGNEDCLHLKGVTDLVLGGEGHRTLDAPTWEATDGSLTPVTVHPYPFMILP